MLTKTELEDFDRLADRFFGRGFASLTKTEVEVYLFDVYMRGVERVGNEPSYYAIGRELGISESRVRTLAEKRSLYFYEPPSVDECLLYLLDHAPTEFRGDVVRIQVNDVNILRALQDYMESRELGYEPELSGRAFRVTLPSLLSILDAHFGEEVTGQAVRRVCEQARAAGEIVGSAEARTLSEIARDPDTYLDLLEPLVVDQNPISFLRRLGGFIREARSSRG